MKITNEHIDQELKDRKIIRVGNYSNAHSTLEWECAECRLKWLANWNNIKSGRGCPTCAARNRGKARRLGIEAAQKEAVERGGELLSEQYESNRSRLTWKCANGHVWKASLGNVKRGAWCRKCAAVSKGARQKLTLSSVEDELEKRGGKLLGAYVNSKTKMSIECSSGHIFMMKWDHVKSGSWCPSCSAGTHESQPEIELREFLRKVFPSVRKEPAGKAIPGTRFEFDIFEPIKGRVIEFDGPWHRTPDGEERDRRKDSLIHSAGYELLRVDSRRYQTEPERIRLECIMFLAE